MQLLETHYLAFYSILLFLHKTDILVLCSIQKIKINVYWGYMQFFYKIDNKFLQNRVGLPDRKQTKFRTNNQRKKDFLKVVDANFYFLKLLFTKVKTVSNKNNEEKPR